MSKTAWIIFSLGAVTILSLMVVFSGREKLDLGNIDINKIQIASKDNGNISDHIFGKEDSSVILVNYGDYQCPGCGAQHYVVEDILEEYGDKITFVFRNYPLTSIHPNALAAAGAAEAAGLQGKFWEMHNKLYESQSDWENLTLAERNNKFAEYAEVFGLDINQFTSDMSSEEVQDKIYYDQSLGKTIPITATPSFVLNGKLLDSKVWGDEDAFRIAIDDALIEASANQ